MAPNGPKPAVGAHSETEGSGDPAAVVREVLAAAYAGRLEALDAHPGMAALRGALPKVFAAFPDFAAELGQQVVEGERVATHWVLRGTHRGELFGIAPTGKAVQFQNLSIARVEGGRITQFNSEAGWLAALMQIGALPLARPGGAGAPR